MPTQGRFSFFQGATTQREVKSHKRGSEADRLNESKTAPPCCGLFPQTAICNPQSGGSLLVLFGVFLLETLDAARSVNQLLFAGEERVAVRADFHVNVFLRRTSRPRMTAGANDSAFDIFWMNSFFHSHFSFYLNKSRSSLAAMTHDITGAKRANDGKAQKYPIKSCCVKVGAFGPCNAARYRER